MDTLELSAASRSTAGVLLLGILAVQVGGLYLLLLSGGKRDRTPFQLAFARAGHAHAGVLVVFGLVCQLFVDAVTLARRRIARGVTSAGHADGITGSGSVLRGPRRRGGPPMLGATASLETDPVRVRRRDWSDT